MDVVSPPSLDILPYIERVVKFIFAHRDDVAHGFIVSMSYLTIIAIPVSLLLIIGIVLSVERLKRIRKREELIYDTPKEVVAHDVVTQADPALGDRWRKILEHLETENQNDWRQAVIEADIILDEILTKQGYKGESIGEKLKRVEKADFATLDSAWEAHLVRNRIAHDGASYELNKYEARRIINLYKQVFSEFYYI
ncbi:MAG: hypothetical protein HZA80_00075 [Candidatus Taylorbacteria bacterium]|nr:hypothetical protein [Candidatus Taylorbacteria bacterium]